MPRKEKKEIQIEEIQRKENLELMTALISTINPDLIHDFRKSLRNYLFGEIARSLLSDNYDHAADIIDKLNTLGYTKDEFARVKKETVEPKEKPKYRKRYNPKTDTYWMEEIDKV